MMNLPLTCIIILTFGFVAITKKTILPSDKVAFLNDFLRQSNEKHGIIEDHMCWDHDERIILQKLLSNLRISYAKPLNFTISQSFHPTYLADSTCPDFHELMEDVLQTGLAKYPNKWLIFSNTTSITNQGYYFPVNTYILVVNSNDGILSVETLYKLKNSSEYHVSTVAEWSMSTGFIFFDQLNLIKNRTNFFKMPLRVSYVVTNNDSFQHESLLNNREKHIDKPTKINYLLYEHLVDIWNMTHEKVLRKEWGMQFHPEKLYYKGMLGDLCHDRADAAGTVQFTPTERLKYFKFLVSTTKEMKIKFVFRAPPLPYSSNLFALPFDGKVWIGCAAVLVLCCLVIWITIKWEIDNPDFIAEREMYEENAPDFLDIVLMQIGVVCQISYSFKPRSTAAKIATLSLLVGFVYIYNAFCARIVILLQSTANNLNNYKDLYYSKIDMGVEEAPYNKYYFSNPNNRANEAWRKLIYETKIMSKNKHPVFYSTAEGLKLVKQSYFALHVEYTTATDVILATFTNEEMCAVRVIESIYKEDVPYISCPVNSTFTEYLLIGFHRLFETGLHSREARRKFSKLPKCTGRNSIFVSVGIIECYFAVEVFLVGVILSLVVFAVELVCNTYLEKRKQVQTVVLLTTN